MIAFPTSQIQNTDLSRRPLIRHGGAGRGRPPKLMRRDDAHRPVSVKTLALGLPQRAWRTIEWREGAARASHARILRQADRRRAARALQRAHVTVTIGASGPSRP